jgi:hypothetical protein
MTVLRTSSKYTTRVISVIWDSRGFSDDQDILPVTKQRAAAREIWCIDTECDWAPPFCNFAAEPHCPIDWCRLAKLCEGAMQTGTLS